MVALPLPIQNSVELFVGIVTKTLVILGEPRSTVIIM